MAMGAWKATVFRYVACTWVLTPKRGFYAPFIFVCRFSDRSFISVANTVTSPGNGRFGVAHVFDGSSLTRAARSDGPSS
jgi:hypothetical protein